MLGGVESAGRGGRGIGASIQEEPISAYCRLTAFGDHAPLRPESPSEGTPSRTAPFPAGEPAERGPRRPVGPRSRRPDPRSPPGACKRAVPAPYPAIETDARPGVGDRHRIRGRRPIRADRSDRPADGSPAAKKGAMHTRDQARGGLRARVDGVRIGGRQADLEHRGEGRTAGRSAIVRPALAERLTGSVPVPRRPGRPASPRAAPRTRPDRCRSRKRTCPFPSARRACRPRDCPVPRQSSS